MYTNRLKSVFLRIWHSPTITTWGSFFSRPLSLILVTPLVLSRLSVDESSLWLIFGVYIGFQSLADFGFSATMVRAYSYCMGGAKEIRSIMPRDEIITDGLPNWDLANKVNSTVRYLYLRIGIVFLILLSTIGTWSLRIPISKTNNQPEAWIAWSIIILVTSAKISYSDYAIYLRGINKVALIMRWQTLFSTISILSSFVVILKTNSLFWLIINNQIWVVVNIIRDKLLCNSVADGRYNQFKNRGIDKSIINGTLPSAWRTWVAQLTSMGIIQASGIVYAQLADSAEIAGYLFALKLINYIQQFSNAPFYSKLPLLARLYANNNIPLMLSVAKRGIKYSLLTYVFSFIVIGISANRLLLIINSKVQFVSDDLWLLMGIAFFFFRYGGMHIQMYSISNHVIAHYANGVAGIIYIFGSVILYEYFGVYAFPASYLIGNLCFFSWYSAMNSYKLYNLSFPRFEYSTSIPSALIIIIYASYIVIA